MILLALLVPALMMAFLFAMDALEELLFPRLTAAGDVNSPADGIQELHTVRAVQASGFRRFSITGRRRWLII